MNKKYTNMLLIGAGVGLICFMAYQALSGAFSSGKVYYKPDDTVVHAEGNVEQTAQNYNALGFRLISRSENMCVSPNMIASNLGFYYEGAVDEGREEAATMLGSDENVKENHAALLNALQKGARPTYDGYFSGLFMDKNTKPKETFVNSAPFYKAYFETSDFYDFAGTRDKINAAANELSGGKITRAVNEVYPKSSMIFVSALSVKEEFSDDVGQVTEETKEVNGQRVAYYNIEKARVSLYEDDNALFVSIPLKNGYDYEVIMSQNDINALTLADIKSYRDRATESVVAIALPKPKEEQYHELKDTLKNAGFSAAFDKTTIIMNLTDSVKVKVDKIDHSVNFELMAGQEGSVNGSVAKSVNIDKPYYFMLSHRETGCKTIMGKKTL